MEKKKRGEFELSDSELGSREMVLIAMSILESRGYPGFVELLSVLEKPELILKIIRFLYGTTIKVPSLGEFVTCLRAAEFTYCDFHKRINQKLPAQPKQIQEFMGIDDEEVSRIQDVFQQWIEYMNKQGIHIEDFMHINRQNTLRRIKAIQKGTYKKGQYK